jgi:hypothetical protein
MSRNRGQCIIIKENHQISDHFTTDQNSDTEESDDKVFIDNGDDNIATLINPAEIKNDNPLSYLKKPEWSNTKKEYRSKQSRVRLSY